MNPPEDPIDIGIVAPNGGFILQIVKDQRGMAAVALDPHQYLGRHIAFHETARLASLARGVDGAFGRSAADLVQVLGIFLPPEKITGTRFPLAQQPRTVLSLQHSGIDLVPMRLDAIEPKRLGRSHRALHLLRRRPVPIGCPVAPFDRRSQDDAFDV